MPDHFREKILSSSKVKISLAVLSLLFALFSLLGTLVLLGQKQEIRKLAEGPTPTPAPITCRAFRDGIQLINNTDEDITTTIRWFAIFCDWNPGCTCNGQLIEETVVVKAGLGKVLFRGFTNMHPACGDWAWQTYVEGPCTATDHGCGNSGCCCGPTPSTCLTPGVSPAPTVPVTPTPLHIPTPTATPILTPTPTPKITGTPTPGITATPTPEPSLTPTPTPYSAYCEHCWAYNQSWTRITDFSNIWAGQTIYFATKGTSSFPLGATKARFRVNGGSWQETTLKHGDEFYIEYPIPAQGEYTVESMIYVPELNTWF